MKKENINSTHEKIEGLFKEISPYVVQLFKKNGDSEPVDVEPWCSGVLIQINGNYYLCTAGHTYSNVRPIDIGFCIFEDFYILEGDISYLPNNYNDENRNADIAICKLSNGSTTDLLQKYKFLNFDKIRLNHNLSTESRYYIFGYPVTKTKKNKQKMTIKSQPFKLVTKGINIPSKYEVLQKNATINFLLDFHKDKLTDKTGQKKIAPKPYGNSGTGLWYYENGSLYLVGIMIEWIHEESVFVSTRIDFAMEMIRYKFDSKVFPSNIISPKFE